MTIASTTKQLQDSHGFTPAKDPSSIIMVGGKGMAEWARKRSLTAAAVDYTGGSMIALYPSPEQATLLAQPDGQPADDLHVTLAFLPEAPADPELLAGMLAQVAHWFAPLAGAVGGLGMFAEGPDGVPVIALPDVVGLNELRAGIVEMLEMVEQPYARDHGFCPHVTLAYGAGGSVDLEVVGAPLSFDAVSLVVGAERWDLPLGAAVLSAGNPYHEPAGTPVGGRFAHRPGGPAPQFRAEDFGLGYDEEPGQTLRPDQIPGLPDYLKPVGPDRLAREVLQGAKDTQTLYADEHGLRGYTVRRVRDVQAPIIAQAFDGKTPHQPQPETLFLAGGSGAGKSSILDQLADVPESAVLVNPDDVKEKLPEYRRMVEGGSKYASMGVHEESSDVAKQILGRASAQGYNAIVDGTGDSAPGKFYAKIEAQEKLGRRVKVVQVDIPTDVAIGRADARAARTGRFVPHSEIRKIHKGVSVNHLDWRDKVGDWEVWANDDADQGGRRLIARRVGGGPREVLDEARYQQMLDKADE